MGGGAALIRAPGRGPRRRRRAPPVRPRGAARAGDPRRGGARGRLAHRAGAALGRQGGAHGRDAGRQRADRPVYDVWLGEAALPGRVVASVYRATIDGDGVSGLGAGTRGRRGRAAGVADPAAGAPARRPDRALRPAAVHRRGRRAGTRRGRSRSSWSCATIPRRASGGRRRSLPSSPSGPASRSTDAVGRPRAARPRSGASRTPVGAGPRQSSGRALDGSASRASIRRGRKCSQPSSVAVALGVVRQAAVAQPHQRAVAVGEERRPRRGCHPVARPPPDPPSPR